MKIDWYYVRHYPLMENSLCVLGFSTMIDEDRLEIGLGLYLISFCLSFSRKGAGGGK